MRTCSRLRCLLLLIVVLLSGLPCYPQAEQILSFHSDITLEEDSSLQVTETIDVFVTGHQIHHGIYREFPTRYRDTFNNRYVVGFQMFGATRDGANEPFRVQDYSKGKQIYLGTPSEMVSRGRHVYTISYTTNRQLGFFKDHDELFWNVTGNGWGFPIEHATAMVHLPASIPADKVKLSGFTGTQGSYQTQLTFAPSDDAFQFATTGALGPHQGLSILLMWPKGYFAEPTFAEKLQFFFEDNRDALLLSCGFLVLLLYYLIAWSAVGRDPAPGVIMARYLPPQNLSPAGMRYLRRMGFDNKTFSAAILDMAVRGFLTIKEQAGSYTLYLTGKSNVDLPPDEQQVAQYLFDGRDQIWLHQENHQTIQAALKALKKWLANAEQKAYFVTNSRYLIPPVVLSVVIVISYLVALGMPQVVMSAFLGFWLTIWTLAVAGLLLTAVNAWRGVMDPHLSRFGGVSDTGKAVLITFFALPFLGGEAMGFWFLLKITSLVLVLFLLASGLLHVVFLYLLKAPTFTGRQLMDQVEGFKMFLGAVDGDRLNRVMPPQQTPAVFESFLPYALALDVEQDWAEKFSTLLASAGTTPGANTAAYAPSFYSGGSSNSFSGARFASSFGGSLTSAISSSATAPGSAGGGGSGGSGGGGGGGGGGGW
jgi:hypothetical protein